VTILIEDYRGKRLFIEDVVADLHQRIAALEQTASTTDDATKFSRVIGPVSTHRAHANQSYVTLGFGSEELCTEFMRALNRLFTDNRAAGKGESDEQ